MTSILDGKAIAKDIRKEVEKGCSELQRECGIIPGLTVVLVGDDDASAIYVRNKEKTASKIGMKSDVIRMPATTGEEEILATVDRLNNDASVHGILVQLPLPDGVDSQRVIERIDPYKDVDGFHPVSAGRLMVGMAGMVPCTPAGIMELLKRYDIPLKGKRAVVVGRSNIVGKPMALLLLREHCTVTICHSRTENLPAVCAQADILVAAVGKVGLVTGDFIKPGAAVVDVGMHSVTDETLCRELFGEDQARLATLRKRGATLAGDVNPSQAFGRAGWLSPVPGGVGPLTIALLMRNTLEAARTAAIKKGAS